MIECAVEAGVDMLDTARAYGEAETVIGRALRPEDRERFTLVTKVAPDVWMPGMSDHDALDRLARSIDQSRRALGSDRLDVVLLHRAAHRTACNGALWEWLRRCVQDGVIGRLGISAASPGEAVEALGAPGVEVIQVAANLLDQRLVHAGFFAAATAAGVEVHLRSAFLQGVAFLDPEALPPHLAGASTALRMIAASARREGVRPAELWLRHARSLSAHRIVLGCETRAQLEANIDAMRRPVPTGLIEELSGVAVDDPSIVDPSQWPRA